LKIVEVVPRKVVVVMEWEAEELEMLSYILSNCEYRYNSEDQYSVKVKNFLEGKLYPFLEKIADVD